MNRSVNLSTKYQPYREVSTSAQCVNLTANCQPQHKAATISARSVHLSVKYQSQREVSTSIQAAISAWSTNLSRKQQSQYDTSTLTRSTNLTAKCQPQHTVSASVQSINLSTKYNSVWIHCVEIATSCWDLYFTLRLLLCIEVNTSHWDWWWGWYFVVRLTPQQSTTFTQINSLTYISPYLLQIRPQVSSSSSVPGVDTPSSSRRPPSFGCFHSDKFVHLYVAIPPPPRFLQLTTDIWTVPSFRVLSLDKFLRLFTYASSYILQLFPQASSSSSLPLIDYGGLATKFLEPLATRLSRKNYMILESYIVNKVPSPWTFITLSASRLYGVCDD